MVATMGGPLGKEENGNISMLPAPLTVAIHDRDFAVPVCTPLLPVTGPTSALHAAPICIGGCEEWYGKDNTAWMTCVRPPHASQCTRCSRDRFRQACESPLPCQAGLEYFQQPSECSLRCHGSIAGIFRPGGMPVHEISHAGEHMVNDMLWHCLARRAGQMGLARILNFPLHMLCRHRESGILTNRVPFG